MAVTGPAQEPGTQDEWRRRVLADPGLILDDPELMRALVLTSERAMGGNVVDLRAMAMERLETRLERLDETHRAVIAAAYENLSATNQVHRAFLRLLDAEKFDDFVLALGGDVAQILRVDNLRLVLESADTGGNLGPLSRVLVVRPAGFVASYMSAGRPTPPRPIVLRQGEPPAQNPYGNKAHDLRSEALISLDLGKGRLPGMLAMGAEDPHHFKPGQGTDLIGFFAGAFERVLRRWLA
ncbi:DUF484 family protein [Pararhodobacter oceanensis]|uniref:DUF484 domain-containing protein n=1 Tax=Pararhodobacter oceanensis TaxID=2172121 RepID=A0A2T8HYF4_9RHOB|nr:DUF484 family protein [Pararhodobacter oceanensis]PVH30466.1 DUF484 domain-containing protein [Pararhodobacter oceanensis]